MNSVKPKRTITSLPLLFLLVASLFFSFLPDQSQAQTRIMPLGNSITQGNGNQNSYRRPLWHLLKNAGYSVDFVGSLQTNFEAPAPNPDFDLDHEGHWGWRADELQANLKSWAIAAKPDIVLMHAGSNDMFQKQTVSSTIDDLSRMIDDLRVANPSVTILFAQLIGSDWNAEIAALNQEIPKLAALKNTTQSRIIVVDQATGFYHATDTYDWVHPNSSGEQKMANKWFDALKTVLSATPLPAPRDPENPSNTVTGVEYKYYEGTWSVLPTFSSLTAAKSGNVANFDLSVRNRNDNFAFQYTGFVTVPTDGTYTFYTSSDDGSKLYIGSTEVVNNDGLHAMQERSGTISLRAGKHAITVSFFEATGGEGLTVSYAGPGITKQPIPNSALFRSSTTTNPGTGFSGTYKITARHSGKALDVNQSSTTDGANVQQWIDNGTAAQQWIITPTSDGYYKLVSKASGKALEVARNSLSDGGNVQQWSYIGSNSQQWKIEATTDGYYRLLNRNSGKALDVAGVSAADGANVHQWTYGGGNNQQWKLELLSAATTRAGEEELSLAEVTVYPNPTKGVVNLKIQSEKAQETKISLINIKGRSVLSLTENLLAGENTIVLEAGHLPTGMYIVKIQQGKKLIIKKVELVK